MARKFSVIAAFTICYFFGSFQGGSAARIIPECGESTYTLVGGNNGDNKYICGKNAEAISTLYIDRDVDYYNTSYTWEIKYYNIGPPQEPTSQNQSTTATQSDPVNCTKLYQSVNNTDPSVTVDPASCTGISKGTYQSKWSGIVNCTNADGTPSIPEGTGASVTIMFDMISNTGERIGCQIPYSYSVENPGIVKEGEEGMVDGGEKREFDWMNFVGASIVF